MSKRTLFLAWQDVSSREWFPVGRLDADVGKAFYRFRYIGGAERARKKVGFPPLLEFPDLQRDYRSSDLFPLFQNRVMNRKRPDFADYLRSLDLSEEADSIEILSANGGRRKTDSYEVFPKIEKDGDGRFRCRFFLHGSRHVAEAQKRIGRLRDREPLCVTVERTNEDTDPEVQIQTMDRHKIGWSPKYLVPDLATAMDGWPDDCQAKVVRLNPPPVVIEVRGKLGKHDPMSSSDFEPLVP